MTRETRLNLIFLFAFLAISLPGAVMLVKKKMRPGASPAPLSRPDPVRRQLPYMAPQVTFDDVTRYVPPLTRQWLIDADRTRGGAGEFLLHNRLPPLSADRALQVLSLSPQPDQMTLTLLLWDQTAQNARVLMDGRPATVIASELIDIPPEVRQELQSGGFVTPPRKILWLKASASRSDNSGHSIQVQVQTGDVTNRAARSVNLFTS